MAKGKNGGDEAGMFRTLYDTEPNGRYVVEATGEFIVCDVDSDGRTCGVLGPARAGYRRFGFVSRGSRIAVVCEAPGTWHRLIDLARVSGAEDAVDSVPQRLPVPKNRQQDMRQLVREELVALLRRREEIDYGRALTPEERARDEMDFDMDDFPDEAPESMFQVDEMPFDDELELEGGVNEIRRAEVEDSPRPGDEDPGQGPGAESGKEQARTASRDAVRGRGARGGRRADPAAPATERPVEGE